MQPTARVHGVAPRLMPDVSPMTADWISSIRRIGTRLWHIVSKTTRDERPVDSLMRDVEISEIWIDSDGHLCARLADASLALTHIHRASASGVRWDDRIRAVCSPIPRDWSYVDWFVQIVKDARSEYGIELRLSDSANWRDISSDSRAAIIAARLQLPPYEPQRVDDRTMAGYVGDDRLRHEARALFNRKQWEAVVAKLEALQYPQFMDAADRRRLEIARKRSRPT